MASVVLLGLGKMGSAMALRLREKGVSMTAWNRSKPKVDALCSADLPGTCIAANSAVEAVDKSSPDSTIMLVLSDTQSTLDVLAQVEAQGKLKGRTVVNLASGSPDDGRHVAASLPAGTCYIDGAYCGAPSKARQGAGVLFLSSADAADIERLRPTFELLGETVSAGAIGASRAIDYAVVDLALVCYSSFFSNVEMLEREGVDPAQFYEQAGKRLATVPPAIAHLHGRLGTRTDASYHEAPIATQETLHNFWTSRLAYFAAKGIPSDWPEFMASLHKRAATGTSGGEAHWGADVTRLQEVMRPPPPSKI